jgi:hypothetical protein
LASPLHEGKLRRVSTRVLLRFLQTLHDSGMAEIAPPERDLAACLRKAGGDSGEARQLDRLLEGWHGEALLDLPGHALDHHPEAALWGALLLFRAACLASFHDLGEAEIRELLTGRPLPDASNPAAHFSADLSLRHWPPLFRMARARSEDDPLVKVMHSLAATFPLSSPGMHLELPAESPVFRHAGLHQLFAERALERADHACLARPATAALIRAKLGAYSADLGRGLLSPALDS